MIKIDLEKCIVNKNDTIKKAFTRLEDSNLGLVVVVDKALNVIGVATDGDIRRGLLNGSTLSSKISECYKSDFVFATTKTTRERLLKLLDYGYKAIPLIDDGHKLKNIVTRQNIPLNVANSEYYRARAPVRVSFGGGGSDLTQYFENKTGAVINATVSLYSHAFMKLREDRKINITSYDINSSIHAENLKQAIKMPSKLGLIQSILKVIEPEFGFDLFLNSDFPVGSGLGGSSSTAASVIGCLNMIRSEKWTLNEIAEIAFQAERFDLGISGGWQDQYAAVFGGFNFIEFNSTENNIIPLKLDQKIICELEESLILCETGIAHNSGEIHTEQKKNLNVSKIKDLVSKNVSLSYEIRNHLVKGRLKDFGKCLHQAWELKKRFSKQITSSYLEKIYSDALVNGATGGKLMGAGGGGYFLFHVLPFEKHSLTSHLKKKGLKVHPFRFESEGLTTWTFQ